LKPWSSYLPLVDIGALNYDDRRETPSMKSTSIGTLLLSGMIAFGQAPTEPFPPAATVKQLMLDLIYPSSNDILVAIYRGGPKNEREWAALRRAALTLAES